MKTCKNFLFFNIPSHLFVIGFALIYLCTSSVEARKRDVDATSDTIKVLSNSSIVTKHLDSLTKSDKAKTTPNSTATNLTITSNNSSSIRLTMGTAALNAIHIIVTDEYGKPVPNVEIIVSAEGGIGVLPGFVKGKFLTEMKTNENGEFAAMLIADLTTVSQSINKKNNTTKQGNNQNEVIGVEGLAPTKDELDEQIIDSIPHEVILDIAGITMKYQVDIGMGPELVIISDDIGLEPGKSQWVGMTTEKPVVMKLVYLQRTDECHASDDDKGDWLDESFSINKIRISEIPNVPHSITAQRVDGIKDTILLDSVLDDYQKEWPRKKRTLNPYKKKVEVIKKYSDIADKALPMSTFVTMDRALGYINVVYKTYKTDSIYYSSDICYLNSDWYRIKSLNNSISINTDNLINTILLLSFTTSLSVTVKDKYIPEPDPDPYPHIKSYSGMNIEKLNIKLNNKVIFDSSMTIKNMEQYPHYIKAQTDEKELKIVNREILEGMSPLKFTFTYHPTAEEYNLGGNNKIEVTGIEDRVGNTAKDSISEFTVP